MEREDKTVLNQKLVKALNDTIKSLGIDYKDIANVLYYSDNAYINRILNNKKIMTLATLANICNALSELKKQKNLNISDENLKPSYFLALAGY